MTSIKTLRRLASISEKINSLTDLDRGLSVFGSSSHEYKKNPVLTETQLREFELSHDVELPEEYRLFLSAIANGGVGPYYGLLSLAEGLNTIHTYSDDEANPCSNFEFTNKTISDFIAQKNHLLDEGNDDRMDSLEPPEPANGVIVLAQYGCGNFFLLVVSGEQKGTVWFTDFCDSIQPLFKENKQKTFFDWFEDWLDNSLSPAKPAQEKDDQYWPADAKVISYSSFDKPLNPNKIQHCTDVRRLNLSGNGYKEFPVEVCTFKELRTLDLSNNSFTSISPEISGLPFLKRLHLTGSVFKNFPTEMQNIPSLEELDLRGCEDIVELPEIVDYFPNLKYLNLTRCKKFNALPTDINKLSQLQTINLDNCWALNDLPDSLCRLSKLQTLILDGTNITKLPEKFGDLHNLDALYLGADEIDFIDSLEKISKLPKLGYLQILSQQEIPVAIEKLTSLTHLTITMNYDLYRQGIEKFALAENITLIPFLEVLTLTNNNQLSNLPNNIGNLGYLRELYLPSSINSLPESIFELQRIEIIQGIRRDKNESYGLEEKDIGKLKKQFPNAQIIFL